MPTLDLAPHHLTALRTLLEHHVPAKEVWAFGSRVAGQSHEGSDLDVVVRNLADLTRSLPEVAGLKDALEASALPMLVDVHDWAELPNAFKDEISRCYVVLQGADTDGV